MPLPPLSSEEWKVLAEVVAAAVALATLVVTLSSSVFEYRRRGAQRRFQHFLVMRRRFKGNKKFRDICDLLEKETVAITKLRVLLRQKERTDLLDLFDRVAKKQAMFQALCDAFDQEQDAELKTAFDFVKRPCLAIDEVPFKERRDFLGFFEEIALMTNTRLISLRIAHYMFGYYAIQCWKSLVFWSNLQRESDYWSLFRDFAGQMEKVQKVFEYKRTRFRF